MRYVYQLTWEDGSECGYFSSIPKLIKFLPQLLKPEQYPMVNGLIVYKHGVDEQYYREYSIKLNQLETGFIVIPGVVI